MSAPGIDCVDSKFDFKFIELKRHFLFLFVPKFLCLLVEKHLAHRHLANKLLDDRHLANRHLTETFGKQTFG
jgi:hypothetical protein